MQRTAENEHALCTCTCGERKELAIETTCHDLHDLTVHSTPRSLSVILRGTICYEASRVSAVAEETPNVRTEKSHAPPKSLPKGSHEGGEGG